jgi:ATP-dependent Lhr-like helicase
MFTTRWRWNSTIALAIARRHGGKRRPAQWQRQDAENLLTQVFPMQLACAENVSGEREVPDHPLVQQTITDCLQETMDLEGLVKLLQGLREGAVQLTCCDGHKPSVLAQELLVARPYAFLDDAPAEERRTRSVGEQAALPGEGVMDSKEVDNLRHQAQGVVGSADQLEEWLLDAGFVAAAEGEHQGWREWFAALCAQGRATQVNLPEGQPLWLADQHAELVQRLHPQAHFVPPRPETNTPSPELSLHGDEAAEVALRALLRQRLQALGLWDGEEGVLADSLGVDVSACRMAIAQLVAEGAVLQLEAQPDGRSFWCGRQLARRCRAQAGRAAAVPRIHVPQPADAATRKRFLGAWHGLAVGEPAAGHQDEAGLKVALEHLAALPVPVAAWEQAILPARLPGLRATALDALLHTGRWVWLRPEPPALGAWRGLSLRHVPVALLPRSDLSVWLAARSDPPSSVRPSGRAALVLAALERFGALFSDELQARVGGMLELELKQALRELVALGLVRCDGWAGLRALLQASPSRHRHRYRRARIEDHLAEAGRWVALDQGSGADPAPWAERMARLLLDRYGIVFYELLAHEPMSPPWRALRDAWRTMEARGEVRMGRFVAGCSGEQYALDEAVTLLQRIEARGPDGQEWLLHAADPIHTASLHHGQRPERRGDWMRYRDGVLLEEGEPGAPSLRRGAMLVAASHLRA